MIGLNHMDFNLPAPREPYNLVIDQDKVTFRENLMMNRSIILTLEFMFVSLISQGCITTLLIELLKV
jgi:hypothetical protein